MKSVKKVMAERPSVGKQSLQASHQNAGGAGHHPPGAAETVISPSGDITTPSPRPSVKAISITGTTTAVSSGSPASLPSKISMPKIVGGTRVGVEGGEMDPLPSPRRSIMNSAVFSAAEELIKKISQPRSTVRTTIIKSPPIFKEKVRKKCEDGARGILLLSLAMLIYVVFFSLIASDSAYNGPHAVGFVFVGYCWIEQLISYQLIKVLSRSMEPVSITNSR
jgi:hypothetical protein